MNILLTSIYNKVSLVNSFLLAYRALGINGKVVAVDIDSFSAGIHAADRGYIVPRLDNENFLSKIFEICEKEKISLIIPTRDEDIPFFANNKKRCNNLGIKVLVPPQATVIVCQDKWRFYQFLKQNNLPAITTWQKYDKHITFPCVVKPRTGKASKGLVFIKNKSALDKINLQDKIIQEKIAGQEYTIDYFADWQARPIGLVSRTRHKVIDGESKISITKNEPEMVNLCRRLGKKLKLIGPNTIQCFKTSQGSIKFLEVNPRFGGGASLGMAAGCKSPEWILRLLLGEKIKPVAEIQENLVMIRYNADIFVPYAKIIDF